MCGLFGMARNPERKNLAVEDTQEIVTALMMLNADRGTDGTGLAFIFDGKPPVIFKKAVPSYFIPASRLYKQVLDLIAENPIAIIGHTRAATVGEATDRNCHPFQKGRIVGAHNGGITNWKPLAESIAVKDIEVDSEVIFELLARSQETIEAFQKLHGGYAVTHWNADDPGALYFTRNYNPLNFFHLQNHPVIFWSSEERHLNSTFKKRDGKNWYFYDSTINRLALTDIKPMSERDKGVTLSTTNLQRTTPISTPAGKRDINSAWKEHKKAWATLSDKRSGAAYQTAIPIRERFRVKPQNCGSCGEELCGRGLPIRIGKDTLCGICTAAGWLDEIRANS